MALDGNQEIAPLLSLDDTLDLAEHLGFLQPPTKQGGLGRLAHYEVLQVLGQGGFGIVLKAFDEKLQRLVAIEVLSPLLAGDSTARERFLQEARAAAAASNEQAGSVYAVEDQPVPYLVMEYIDERTLPLKLNRHEASQPAHPRTTQQDSDPSPPGQPTKRSLLPWLMGGGLGLGLVGLLMVFLSRPGEHPASGEVEVTRDRQEQASRGRQPPEPHRPPSRNDSPGPARYTNRMGMEFVRIPEGKSWLDGGGGVPGTREAAIPSDFYLGKYEVTQEQWQA